MSCINEAKFKNSPLNINTWLSKLPLLKYTHYMYFLSCRLTSFYYRSLRQKTKYLPTQHVRTLLVYNPLKQPLKVRLWKRKRTLETRSLKIWGAKFKFAWIGITGAHRFRGGVRRDRRGWIGGARYDSGDRTKLTATAPGANSEARQGGAAHALWDFWFSKSR